MGLLLVLAALVRPHRIQLALRVRTAFSLPLLLKEAGEVAATFSPAAPAGLVAVLGPLIQVGQFLAGLVRPTKGSRVVTALQTQFTVPVVVVLELPLYPVATPSQQAVVLVLNQVLRAPLFIELGVVLERIAQPTAGKGDLVVGEALEERVQPVVTAK